MLNALYVMGSRRNFREGAGPKKSPHYRVKSSSKAPNIAKIKITRGGGATAYSCPPPPTGAHAHCSDCEKGLGS